MMLIFYSSGFVKASCSLLQSWHASCNVRSIAFLGSLAIDFYSFDRSIQQEDTGSKNPHQIEGIHLVPTIQEIRASLKGSLGFKHVRKLQRHRRCDVLWILVSCDPVYDSIYSIYLDIICIPTGTRNYLVILE